MTHRARSILALVSLLAWGHVVPLPAVCSAADADAPRRPRQQPVRRSWACGPGLPESSSSAVGPRLKIELRGGTEATRGTVDMVLLDGDAVPSRVTAPTEGLLELPAGETLRVPLIARLGQLHGQVVVTFRGEAGPLAARSFETAASGPFAGILPVGRELIVRCGQTPGQRQRFAAAQPEWSEHGRRRRAGRVAHELVGL